jgi:hypothetical protein
MFNFGLSEEDWKEIKKLATEAFECFVFICTVIFFFFYFCEILKGG